MECPGPYPSLIISSKNYRSRPRRVWPGWTRWDDSAEVVPADGSAGRWNEVDDFVEENEELLTEEGDDFLSRGERRDNHESDRKKKDKKKRKGKKEKDEKRRRRGQSQSEKSGDESDSHNESDHDSAWRWTRDVWNWPRFSRQDVRALSSHEPILEPYAHVYHHNQPVRQLYHHSHAGLPSDLHFMFKGWDLSHNHLFYIAVAAVASVAFLVEALRRFRGMMLSPSRLAPFAFKRTTVQQVAPQDDVPHNQEIFDQSVSRTAIQAPLQPQAGHFAPLAMASSPTRQACEGGEEWIHHNKPPHGNNDLPAGVAAPMEIPQPLSPNMYHQAVTYPSAWSSPNPYANLEAITSGDVSTLAASPQRIYDNPPHEREPQLITLHIEKLSRPRAIGLTILEVFQTILMFFGYGFVLVATLGTMNTILISAATSGFVGAAMMDAIMRIYLRTRIPAARRRPEKHGRRMRKKIVSINSPKIHYTGRRPSGNRLRIGVYQNLSPSISPQL